MKKVVLVLLILALAGGAAFAVDMSTFVYPIESFDILVSPTFNIGLMWLYGIAMSATVSGDFALPIPVMVGIESGFGFTTEKYGPKMIPILARVSWHPNFELDGFDPFVRLKVGYTVGFGDAGGGLFYDYGKWRGGFSYGAAVGARYFFTDFMGVFLEGGWDRYGVSYDYNEYYISLRWASYVYTYAHAGVTFKF